MLPGKQQNPVSRETLLEQFRNPPFDYGPVDCWWWEAGQLDKKKIRWQLEEMKEKGVAGTFYYPRFVYDQPLRAEPHYWSDGWWEFTKFSVEEHQRLGLQAWFDDWTAHGFFQNKLRAESKEETALTGRRLVIREEESSAPGTIQIEVPQDEEILHAAAYRKLDDGLDYASRQDLSDASKDNGVSWEAKEAGWLVTVVSSQPHDLDYLNRATTERWIELILGVYEEKLRDFVGNTLKAYGTDELDILNGNILYSPSLLQRFKAEKGYEPSPYLVGLFHDIGNLTDKIRCEYHDVLVSMLDENLYKPFSRWLDERGMLFVEFCPRGKTEDMLTQTYQYGDFFRYMGNYSIPGNEENTGRQRTFQAKLASSIAHMYGRSRVGVCCYWTSGWGHNTQENMAWTHENYVYGVNLYNRHGVLYSTLSGWYEWVPPAVHFYQPYWQYWSHFTDYIRRLSYIMSQGVHQADVAVFYPLTTIHANWTGGRGFNHAAQEAAARLYDLGKVIFRSGIDLDYIDYPSLCSAEVSDGRLKLAGMDFRVLVLPPMTTIRTETLEKIKEFYDSGGTVIAFGRLPNASAENGREDPNIQSLLKDIFGFTSSDGATGGKAFFLPDDESRIPEIISNAISQDVVASEQGVYHTHQKIGEVDVYFLFNMNSEKKEVTFSFRGCGEPEIWDTFTGEVKPVHRFEIQDKRTKVRLDMKPYEGIVLVFVSSGNRSLGGKVGVSVPSGGRVGASLRVGKSGFPEGKGRHSEGRGDKGKGDRPGLLEDNLSFIAGVKPGENGIEIHGFDDIGGEKRALALYRNRYYRAKGEVDTPPDPIVLNEPWDSRLEPTMDNRWGDFRYPASEEFIGAEARRFRYIEEGEEAGTELGWHTQEFDSSHWQEVTYSYGPYWWTIGPFEEGSEPEEILREAKSGDINTAKSNGRLRLTDKQHEVAGKQFQWQRYSFSRKFGSEERIRDFGGLAGVSENFLSFAAVDDDRDTTRYLFAHVYSPEEKDYLLDFGGEAEFSREAWVNGEKVISIPDGESQKTIRLRKGFSSVLLRFVQSRGNRLDTYAVFQAPDTEPFFDPYVPLLRWFVNPQDLVFDITPEKENRVGWYRFPAPPGMKAMRLNTNASKVEAWVDGQLVEVKGDKIELESPIQEISQVALRLEQKPGCYAGAAFFLPIAFECEEGRMPLGDWCNHGLKTYSGGVVYTRIVELEERHLAGKVILDLGQVSTTAEVHINGNPAGVKMARPFCFDITGLVKAGENQIQVKVVNTLANHMNSYPTTYIYEGQMVSGLLGPVKLQFLSGVTLTAVPTSNGSSGKFM